MSPDTYGVPQPPPERDLPNHRRRRQELLMMTATREPRPSRLRWAVPAVVAASIAAVAAGAMAVTGVMPGQDGLTAGAGAGKPAVPYTEPAAGAPGSTRVPAAVADQRLADCLAQVGRAGGKIPDLLSDNVRPLSEPASAYRPYFSAYLDDFEPGSKVFMLARGSGDELLACGDIPTLGQAWMWDVLETQSIGISTGDRTKAEPPPVTGGIAWGRYAVGVKRVTVQWGKGPERETLMRDGVYFLLRETLSAEELRQTPGGIPSGHPEVRAYDANGKILWDSATAEQARCLADPDGKLVSAGRLKEPIDLATCRPASRWSGAH